MVSSSLSTLGWTWPRKAWFVERINTDGSRVSLLSVKYKGLLSALMTIGFWSSICDKGWQKRERERQSLDLKRHSTSVIILYVSLCVWLCVLVAADLRAVATSGGTSKQLHLDVKGISSFHIKAGPAASLLLLSRVQTVTRSRASLVPCHPGSGLSN